MKNQTKILILFICIFVITYWTYTMVKIWNYSYLDEKQAADAIIVLGAKTSGGEVSPVYKERLNHAILLYKNGYVDYIIVTGGMGDVNAVSDADAAAQYAISQGIPQEVILLEDKSTITQENIANSKNIMDSNGIHTAILVSDPLHMKRAMKMAENYGIEAYSSPTTTSRYVSLKTKLPFLLRETFFYIGYQIYSLFDAG